MQSLFVIIRSRQIVLPGFPTRELAGHRRRQAEQRADASGYEDHDLVIARRDGSPWPPDSFSSEFRGHGAVGFTLDTCSHLLPGMQVEAAEKMNRAWAIWMTTTASISRRSTDEAVGRYSCRP
jgi:hypothetical protein